MNAKDKADSFLMLECERVWPSLDDGLDQHRHEDLHATKVDHDMESKLVLDVIVLEPFAGKATRS